MGQARENASAADRLMTAIQVNRGLRAIEQAPRLAEARQMFAGLRTTISQARALASAHPTRSFSDLRQAQARAAEHRREARTTAIAAS
jgi:hypothetical protein